MKRLLLILALSVALVSSASAHFIFIVPEPGNEKAKVLLSETLKPDENVDVKLITKTSLAVRTADGSDTTVLLSGDGADHSFSIPLPGEGPRIVHGDLTLGVQKRGEGKPFLLVYHTKTLLSHALEAKATSLGEKAKAEIIASGNAGAVMFQVMLNGKPVAGGKATVILPDGKEQQFTLDAEGRTEAFAQSGRYGVWARCVEPVAGELEGKTFEETRHYPTLVLDVGAGAKQAVAEVKSDGPLVVADQKKYAKLPEAASSFGGVASNGWLYVYGGHIAPTHHYDTNAVSGKFHRLQLDVGTEWQPLESGPALQGMNLAAHDGRIYRVGGMRPLNKAGEPTDNHSVADVFRFDLAAGKWSPLPALPEPRSSHDVVVHDNKLYVIGGWNMKGKAGNAWREYIDVLDLSPEKPTWKSIPQPFKRRALIAAVLDQKIYVVGGFDENDDPSLQVDIFDPAAGTWTRGPDLPGKERNGFAPAACVLDGKLYASVMDGSLLQLNARDNRWDLIARTTPRIVHRLIPHKDEILIVGGADRGKNYDLIESVKPATASTAAAVP